VRNPRLTSTLSTQGRVTVPHELRKQLGLKQGTPYEFLLREDGTLSLRFNQPKGEEANGTSVRGGRKRR
jgi:AbrB family looped-hinge helix DNA binding protein